MQCCNGPARTGVARFYLVGVRLADHGLVFCIKIVRVEGPIIGAAKAQQN